MRTQSQDYQLVRDRQKGQIRAPKRYGFANLIAFALHSTKKINVEEPKSFNETINCQNGKEYNKAINDEINSLYKNYTWELVRKPKNKRIVRCKWIFRIKDGLTTTKLRKFKARLVAKGYT